MAQRDYDDDVRADPTLRKSNVSPWAWVLGLLVVLAIGWAAFEIFDDTDAAPEREAIPAAGQMDRQGEPGSGARQDTGAGETGTQRTPAPADRGDRTTP